jgi:hypothetical protein
VCWKISEEEEAKDWRGVKGDDTCMVQEELHHAEEDARALGARRPLRWAVETINTKTSYERKNTGGARSPVLSVAA